MNNHILDYNLPLLDEVRLQGVARQWVHLSAQVRGGEHVVIVYDFPARQLAYLVAQECLRAGARVTTQVGDQEMEEVLAVSSSERDLRRSQAFRDIQTLEADAIFIIRAQVRLDVLARVPGSQLRHYNAARTPVGVDYRVNYTRWQLLYWPTPAEAELEKMSYEDYCELWLSAAEQPWTAIAAAQESLVERLNRASRLELKANFDDPDPARRTHLTMSIEGMSFVNSTIDNNYPGSEVFSSPVRESVSGQLFAEGWYSYEGRMIRDIRLVVEQGKIVDASATENEAALLEILNRDEGARYFGEVALGTNPGLRRRLFNALLNEKVGGSFHITPGRAYEDTVAPGVHLDNGNRSQIHWDITVMMLPDYGGGAVIVDGETVQENGRFLLPELEVLNANL